MDIFCQCICPQSQLSTIQDPAAVCLAIQPGHANVPLQSCISFRSSKPDQVNEHPRVYKKGKPTHAVHSRFLPSACSYKSSCKHLHNPITTRTNHKPPITAPANIAHPFSPHGAVRHNILRTDPLLQTPEADTRVMTRGNGFAAVLREAESRDRGRVGEHGVGALTCKAKCQ